MLFFILVQMPYMRVRAIPNVIDWLISFDTERILVVREKVRSTKGFKETVKKPFSSLHGSKAKSKKYTISLDFIICSDSTCHVCQYITLTLNSFTAKL